MPNINKKELLEDFISNKEIINKILLENRKVFDYIIKDEKTSKTWTELMKVLINDFIKETFYFYEDIKTNKELLKLVKDYELTEYIDWKIDIYDEDLINSYRYFQEYTDKIEWDFDINLIMKEAQFEWYAKIYEDIKKHLLHI